MINYNYPTISITTQYLFNNLLLVDAWLQIGERSRRQVTKGIILMLLELIILHPVCKAVHQNFQPETQFNFPKN
jgi:hypothetical protein